MKKYIYIITNKLWKNEFCKIWAPGKKTRIEAAAQPSI